MSTATQTEVIEFRYTDRDDDSLFVCEGPGGAIISIEHEPAPFDPIVEVSYDDIPRLLATLLAIHLKACKP